MVVTPEWQHRIIGALFFVGGVTMGIAGIVRDEPGMIVGAVCEFIAWGCSITYANQLIDQG